MTENGATLRGDSVPANPAPPGSIDPADVTAPPEPGRSAPDRNLALELARVTEAGAMAAARWVGRGDKNGADGAAVHAMRTLINTVSMNGMVVIGEGEKDHAPMLYNGEQVGDGSGPLCDVAVDPIDGTRLTANGMPNAISVIAVSARGSMYDPSAVFYMSKLVTGPSAADVVDIEATPRDNIRAVARAKGCSPQDVTVVILDRPRHQQLIADVRAAGARIKLITDGDVAGAIMAARDGTGIDLLLGVGGTPEGIISACAIKCLGGVIQGRLAPRDEAERDRALGRRPRPQPRADHGRPGHVGRRVLRRDRDHRRRADGWRALPGWRRPHPLPGDAGPLRHHPQHPQRAPALEAAGVQFGELRLGRLRPAGTKRLSETSGGSAWPGARPGPVSTPGRAAPAR